MVGQWTHEMNHVAGIVGGFNSQQKVVGQEGGSSACCRRRSRSGREVPDRERVRHPAWMVDEEILRRIEPVGAIERIHNAQNAVLTTLLNSGRFARLVEQETLDGTPRTRRWSSWPTCARASGRSSTCRR